MECKQVSVIRGYVALLLIKEYSKRIFEALGFTEAPDGLRPPATETTTPQGRMNRRRLLRAWVEVGAWIVDFKRDHGGFVCSYDGIPSHR
jgi:ubiquitin carboxyl-terminal hydrolase 25/28